MKKELENFEHLLNIMDQLREGCPWDRKQTWESLRYLTIEETFELSDAILENNAKEISKELGDLMLHIVFYAKIGQEKKLFDMSDVLANINKKLIQRHPHIFGDVKVSNEKEVKDNWERIKLEKEGKKSVLEGVPKSMPAIVKAYRMQEKAAGVGFDWENAEQVWDKVTEEVDEFLEVADNPKEHAHAEEEFGDLLFALINYARWKNINPEDALERANKKFIHRFQHIEERAKETGKNLPDMTLNEMEVFWQEAKKI